MKEMIEEKLIEVHKEWLGGGKWWLIFCLFLNALNEGISSEMNKKHL